MHRSWDQPLQVSLETARLIQIAPDVTCEKFGTRDILGTKLEFPSSNAEKQKTKIFCFGGSTTFGHGVSSHETWPKFLEEVLGDAIVINCGIVKNDLKASLHTYVNVLREGHSPDYLIFLDGVNESSGFRIWDDRFSDYVDYDTNYKQLNGIWNTRKLSRFAYLFIFIFGKYAKSFLNSVNKIGYTKAMALYLTKWTKFISTKKVSKISDGHSVELIHAAANSYLKSKKLISAIAKNFGTAKLYFFLQPSFYDVSGNQQNDSRKNYLSSLYQRICEMDSDVINLSSECSKKLSEEMFFDWQHLDSKGNKVIAEEIAKYIGQIPGVPEFQAEEKNK